jgi:hypothetical protein
VKLSLLALVAVVGVVSACGATSASTQAPAASHSMSDFQNGFLRFQYPIGWRAQQPNAKSVSLHFHPIVFLSDQPTGDACRSDGMTISCGFPVAQLQRGGVLVVVENRGYPGWTLASAPGKAIRVGGRPARRLVVKPGVCGSIGADETVQVTVARPVKSNWTSFTACLRGPALADREREVDAVLASTHFAAP